MIISVNYCMKRHPLFASNHTLTHTFHVPQNFTGKHSNGEGCKTHSRFFQSTNWSFLFEEMEKDSHVRQRLRAYSLRYESMK